LILLQWGYKANPQNHYLIMSFLESRIQNLRFSAMSAELACAFCTQTSASFSIKVGKRSGWVDVHFPCDGHIRVRIRGALPDEYLEPSRIRTLVSALLDQLKIQRDETCEATFFKPTKIIEMGKSVNRDGMSDRIETGRKFIAPDGG
jgi:hypothetical protein